MGKSVVVLPGFSSVGGPSPKGQKSYQAGQTIIFTDAEYLALPPAITRVLSTPATTVPDPVRISPDTAAVPATVNTAAIGALALTLGANVLTLTGALSPTFPTGVAAGSRSYVELYLTQGAGGSKTVTWPSKAKFVGGVAPVISTVAGKVDWLMFRTVDGGTTWLLTDSAIDVR